MNPWLKFAGICVAFIFAGIIFRLIVFAWLEKLFSKTETKLDDLILNSIKNHIVFWFFLAGIVVGYHAADLQEKFLPMIEKSALVLFFFSASFVAADLLKGFIRIYSARKSLTVPMTSLTENLANMIVFILGILLILSNLGIAITPLLTALGVGSLAVALALQDTLSNFFAGIYIIINRQIRVGDYVRLDSGQEGYVTDIGWRSTRIRELPNNIILIPNTKLSQTIVTNYYLPEKEMSIVFQVSVAYESDLKMVETVTIDVAKKVLKEVQGGVSSFDPFIRYHTFGDSGIHFSVILRVNEFVDRYLITHEFMKNLHSRFKKENITIPFPQRVVHQAK